MSETKTEVTPCGTLAPVFVEPIALVRRWVDEVMEVLEGFDDVCGVNVDEVENRSRDGFVPYTDGGFDGIARATMSYAYGSGATPKAIEPYLERSLKEAAESWDEKNPDCTVAMIYAEPEPVALEAAGQIPLPGLIAKKDDWQRRQHPRLEEWYEFESEWLQEGSTYFYKVRVLFHGDRHSSVSGEPEAFFMVGINTDFEYGRDYIPWLTAYGSDPNCTKWLWEKTVKVSELTGDMIEAFIKEAANALRSA